MYSELRVPHAPPAPIRVLLCDAVPVLRTYVREILERDPRVVVVAELDRLPGRFRPLGVEPPDVVVLDLAFAKCLEADAVARIRRAAPGAAIVVLTDADEPAAGADGIAYLGRDVDPRALHEEVVRAAERAG